MPVLQRPFDCHPGKRITDSPTASALKHDPKVISLESEQARTSMSKAAMCEKFCATIRRWRLLEVTTFFALALASLAPAAADDDHHHHRLRFMIQNLYAGSFFQEINAAKTPSEIVAAATLTYQHILATRPAERA